MTTFLEIAGRLIKEHYLCLNCLGRMFAALSTELSNRERGRIILEALLMEISRKLQETGRIDKKLVKKIIFWYKLTKLKKMLQNYEIKIDENSFFTDKHCEVCGNIFNKLDKYVELIIKELDNYDNYKRFTIGIRSLPEMERKEDTLRVRYGITYGESIRNELSRELGKKLLIKRKNLLYSPVNPDITIIIDINREKIHIHTKNLTVRGKIKLVEKSDIKIFSKICSKCRGKGCVGCRYTGKVDRNTIEYIICETLLNVIRGRKWKFSASKENSIISFKCIFKEPKRKVEDIDEILNILNEKISEKKLKILELHLLS